MQKVIIYGYQGFVGSEIFKSLSKTNYDLVGIGRESFYADRIDEKNEIVIHSANSAKRFYVNNNSEIDLNKTIHTTRKILKRHSASEKILISTISCRTEIDTSYGFNRLESEKLWLDAGGMVVRLGPMYGGQRTKDTLSDIINKRHVFLSQKTKYAYSHIKWNAEYIKNIIQSNLYVNKVIEIGAYNTIALKEIAAHFKSTSTFSGKIDDQFPMNFSDGPNAYDVIKFIEGKLYNER